ncbi:MAG: hypothetical protein ACM359_04565 [Bacillota bacterium]
MNVASVGASSSLVQKTDRRLAILMAKIDRAKAILAEYPMQSSPTQQQRSRALPAHVNG